MIWNLFSVDYTVKQLQKKKNEVSYQILKNYVVDGYRICELLETFLKHPKCFSGQITFPISQSYKTLLVKKYNILNFDFVLNIKLY